MTSHFVEGITGPKSHVSLPRILWFEVHDFFSVRLRYCTDFIVLIRYIMWFLAIDFRMLSLSKGWRHKMPGYFLHKKAINVKTVFTIFFLLRILTLIWYQWKSGFPKKLSLCFVFWTLGCWFYAYMVVGLVEVTSSEAVVVFFWTTGFFCGSDFRDFWTFLLLEDLTEVVVTTSMGTRVSTMLDSSGCGRSAGREWEVSNFSCFFGTWWDVWNDVSESINGGGSEIRCPA